MHTWDRSLEFRNKGSRYEETNDVGFGRFACWYYNYAGVGAIVQTDNDTRARKKENNP